ncbi:MAG TPA: LytTR family DNA-binding domain-containing protein, partial [Saprospiraceae bacterium]|nr:LytTR family DNA-binding domain-containing protein [Saprospiraceae bacterium]
NELSASIDKYRQLYGSRPAASPPAADYTALLDVLRKHEPSPTYLRRMLIRFGSTLKLVDMDDVAYFYTKDKITFVVTRSTAKRYPADYPLDRLETLLDPAVFFRINRQVILHVQAIKEMHPYSKSRVKVELDPSTDIETVVSAERSSDFKKWLVGE